MPSGTEQQRFRTGDTRSTAAGEDGMDETLVIGGTRVRRQTLRPGWRASEQPGADAFCQLPHFRYQISGSIGVPLLRRHRTGCGARRRQSVAGGS